MIPGCSSLDPLLLIGRPEQEPMADDTYILLFRGPPTDPRKHLCDQSIASRSNVSSSGKRDRPAVIINELATRSLLGKEVNLGVTIALLAAC